MVRLELLQLLLQDLVVSSLLVELLLQTHQFNCEGVHLSLCCKWNPFLVVLLDVDLEGLVFDCVHVAAAFGLAQGWDDFIWLSLGLSGLFGIHQSDFCF